MSGSPSKGNFIVKYDVRDWTRGGAWENLCMQQIPGCPDLYPTMGTIGWRKAHNRQYWAWRWVYLPGDG